MSRQHENLDLFIVDKEYLTVDYDMLRKKFQIFKNQAILPAIGTGFISAISMALVLSLTYFIPRVGGPESYLVYLLLMSVCTSIVGVSMFFVSKSMRKEDAAENLANENATIVKQWLKTYYLIDDSENKISSFLSKNFIMNNGTVRTEYPVVPEKIFIIKTRKGERFQLMDSHGCFYLNKI